MDEGLHRPAQGADLDPRPSAVTRPASILAGPEGHPVHPILVTVPIGAFVASIIFDIAAAVSDNSAAFARGATWLIVIGLAGAVAAAVFGLLDMQTIPSGTPARATAMTHLVLNSIALVLFALSAWGRFAAWDPPFDTPWWCVALSVVALAGLGASGYLGGKLSYHYGVRVAGSRLQADGYDRTGPRDQR